MSSAYLGKALRSPSSIPWAPHVPGIGGAPRPGQQGTHGAGMCGAPSFRLEVPPWGPQGKGLDVGVGAMGNSRVCPRLVKLRGRPRMKQPPSQVEPRPVRSSPLRQDKGLRGPGSGQQDGPSGLRSGEPGRAVGPVGARPLVVSSTLRPKCGWVSGRTGLPPPPPPRTIGQANGQGSGPRGGETV